VEPTATAGDGAGDPGGDVPTNPASALEPRSMDGLSQPSNTTGATTAASAIAATMHIPPALPVTVFSCAPM
jgi:hypothetical protein